MEFLARYHDGLTAEIRDVVCVIDLAALPVALVILDPVTRAGIAVWAAGDTYALSSRPGELRIGAASQLPGARLLVQGLDNMRRARGLLPSLRARQIADGRRQFGIVAGASAALFLLIFAYVFGVPLLAGQLVHLVPPDWETRLGETAQAQIESILGENGSFDECDSDPSSPGNAAIARFVDAVWQGQDSPFRPSVRVVYSSVPNAYALPGGQAYYFSSLLHESDDPDEFAGVLAHELGHVYHRHGMQTLIATSATGLLVGFVLGDMTGTSVAGGVGSALIDTRFSREAEQQADQFAGETARRFGYRATALVNLIDRVSDNSAFTQALALLSSHPMNDDRRSMLAAYDIPPSEAKPAFTTEEWRAIKAMCAPPAEDEVD